MGSPEAQRGRRWLALIEGLRPAHWVKNLLVLAPMPFSGQADQLWAWGTVLGTLAAFCALASSVYLINDIADRRADQAHPQKRDRPVASGRLSVSRAGVAGAALLVVAAAGIAAVWWALHERGLGDFGASLAAWAGTYVVLNLAYSLGLKRRPILDVVIVSMGFVLRAMAGASATAAVVSPWLVVCTFMLCLFIALGKRRSEIVTLGEQAGGVRHVHLFYNRTNLEHMLAVSAGLAILTYTLYCLASKTMERVGSAHLIWTIPLVVYGMFRYYCLSLNSPAEDPVRIVMRDKVLWLVGLTWLACVAAVVTWGRIPAVRDLLLH